MRTPSKEIIETRLHQWKLFFESEQARSTGFGTVLADNDPRLIQEGADPKTCDVDAVTEAAARLGVELNDLPLIELAELVDMMATNYLWREDDELHAALMQDDPELEPDCEPPPAANPMTPEERATLHAELDAILDAA
ncbi:MAG: hypothetical protein BWK72_08470 [Rhodoferax ferrireducens]|uniref:Uncharacterized protein n=1 Tax=Rhodoferax ferrireducens TaxID=192843 RepID=A0A1W9KUU6_9BURK|nr:MAG: hypothetical protein BWK72_08470 [Rhodoferax ferrireducens]